MPELERSLAVFVDFENLALGFQNRRDRFDITRVLERLVEKGKIVVKRAYADWNRFNGFTRALHESAIELTEIPHRGQSGKNSADIRLCVDAMDLAYSKDHIDTFAIVSGDSDFSPLVSKLKELGKHVIGLGMQDSTSDLLRDNCDEFIYYEDLGEENAAPSPIVSHLPEAKQKAFSLLLESLVALRRENKDVLWSSMIKDTIKRKKPSFNETYHGYRTFSEMLEDAAREGILVLETDKRSRTYVVTRFGSEMQDGDRQAAAPPALPAHEGEPGEAAPPPAQGMESEEARRRGRRRRRGGRNAGPVATGPTGHANGNGNGAYPQYTPIPPAPAREEVVPPAAMPREAAVPPTAMPPAAVPPAPPRPQHAPPRTTQVPPAPPRQTAPLPPAPQGPVAPKRPLPPPPPRQNMPSRPLANSFDAGLDGGGAESPTVSVIKPPAPVVVVKPAAPLPTKAPQKPAEPVVVAKPTPPVPAKVSPKPVESPKAPAPVKAVEAEEDPVVRVEESGKKPNRSRAPKAAAKTTKPAKDQKPVKAAKATKPEKVEKVEKAEKAEKKPATRARKKAGEAAE